MMAVTLGFCCLSYFVQEFYRFQIEQYWALYLFLGLGVVLACIILFLGNEHVSGLTNNSKIIILFLINICFSYVISFCTSYYASIYGAPLVVECMVLTAGLVSALTLYTFIVKVDYSVLACIIIVVVFCFMLFGISFAFTMSGTLHTLYGTFGVIIGAIILVVDTDWIANGDRDCSLDDPVMGALILYIDIIRIFMYMLMALGKKNR